MFIKLLLIPILFVLTSCSSVSKNKRALASKQGSEIILPEYEERYISLSEEIFGAIKKIKKTIVREKLKKLTIETFNHYNKILLTQPNAGLKDHEIQYYLAIYESEIRAATFVNYDNVLLRELDVDGSCIHILKESPYKNLFKYLFGEKNTRSTSLTHKDVDYRMIKIINFFLDPRKGDTLLTCKKTSKLFKTNLSYDETKNTMTLELSKSLFKIDFFRDLANKFLDK